MLLFASFQGSFLMLLKELYVFLCNFIALLVIFLLSFVWFFFCFTFQLFSGGNTLHIGICVYPMYHIEQPSMEVKSSSTSIYSVVH